MTRHGNGEGWRWALVGLAALVIGGAVGCGRVTAQGPGIVENEATSGELLATSGPAVEWPGWRGPTGDGHARGTRLPKSWPREVMPAWEAPLGTGWSSPIVAEGRVFITDRQGLLERVWAFDLASGRELWRRENAVDFDPHPVGRRHGNGPKSTPAAGDGCVYTLGIAGWLQCLNGANGAVVWQVNLPAEFGRIEALPDGRAHVVGEEYVVVPIDKVRGAPVPLFGYTGSLLLTEQLVVLSVGGARGGTIMAFDRRTGAVAWKALAENISYSSPRRATLAGVDQVVVMTGPHVVGLALDDGRLLWEHPFQIQYDESISTPVTAGNLVMFTATGRPLTALRIAPGNAGRQTKSVAWTNRDLESYLSTMLVDGEHVYGMNDGGEMACIALADGRTMWRDGSHGYYTTPVLAEGRLLALNDEGVLTVLAADPQGYRLLGECVLAKEATWSTPAVCGSRLLVRSEAGLRCFDFGER